MTPDRRSFLAAGGATVAGMLTGEFARADDSVAKAFIDNHVSKIRPLEIAGNRAWWDANISGKDEDFKKKEDAQNKIDAALAEKGPFETIKALKKEKDAGTITDRLVARQVELLYLQYLEKQVEPSLLKKLTNKSNAVEQGFNVYRATVNGQELTDSKVRNILKTATDTSTRKEVWEASKGVGAKVESDLKELVTLRNQAAKELGFANFHAMSLYLNEQNGKDLIALFDDLDRLTKEPFDRAKAEIDAKLSKMYGVAPNELMPWHYHDPFFQESPAVFDADIDSPFKSADIPALCRTFYAGIGTPVDRVLTRSDLYEKKGKSPHAFCTDIDRKGDVRVLGNIVPNEYWMGTMLHELGHSVYSTNNGDIPQSLPYVLRMESHILTTEGVAMQMQKFSKSRPWLEKMGVKVADGEKFDLAASKVLRNELLIFSRWCQVMLRFEKGMYEDPKQDLNALWWDLVQKYQGLKKPAGRNAPDYASKIHICTAPVYYHNYMMGQLFASQVHHALCKDLYPGTKTNDVIYIGDKKVGKWMTEKVYAVGRTLSWNDLLKYATGAGLNPEAFAKDFKG
jgi:peptidyl-dipeptidase A